MKYHIHDIVWDVDDDEDLADLPMEFDLEMVMEEGDDEEERLSDLVSDTYGFCHKGFQFERI